MKIVRNETKIDGKLSSFTVKIDFKLKNSKQLRTIACQFTSKAFHAIKIKFISLLSYNLFHNKLCLFCEIQSISLLCTLGTVFVFFIKCVIKWLVKIVTISLIFIIFTAYQFPWLSKIFNLLAYFNQTDKIFQNKCRRLAQSNLERI